MEQFTLKLEEEKSISPFTKHFVFSRTDGKNLNFVPGQFISLLINKDGTIARRNYSLANPPNSNYIEIACAYIKGGLGSELLFNMDVGDEIQAAGPFGQLILPAEHLHNRYFFFATGTGVTPYRSMLPEIAARLFKKSQEKAHCEFHVIFGVRVKEELLYREDFVAFASIHPNFKFHACYSRLQASVDRESYEYLGRVQDRVNSLNIANNDIIYLCGNPNMVDDVFEMLLALGVERRNIKREKYISPKF